jgi:23S rRNA A2030 N6-methylase RlmJ
MFREILIVGAVLAAKYYFSETEKEAKENWESKKEETKKTIEDHQNFINENIKQAENSYNFHYLTEIHYSSMMVGNNAYNLFKDAKKTLNGINKILSNSKKHKISLQEKISVKGTPNKKDFKEELISLNEMRKGLFNERDIIKKEQEDMMDKVRELNKGTGSLKLHIKNYCGSKGDMWYNKIEDNKKRNELKRKELRNN